LRGLSKDAANRCQGHWNKFRYPHRYPHSVGLSIVWRPDRRNRIPPVSGCGTGETPGRVGVEANAMTPPAHLLFGRPIREVHPTRRRAFAAWTHLKLVDRMNFPERRSLWIACNRRSGNASRVAAKARLMARATGQLMFDT
jgi:hypothetical protein